MHDTKIYIEKYTYRHQNSQTYVDVCKITLHEVDPWKEFHPQGDVTQQYGSDMAAVAGA